MTLLQLAQARSMEVDPWLLVNWPRPHLRLALQAALAWLLASWKVSPLHVVQLRSADDEPPLMYCPLLQLRHDVQVVAMCELEAWNLPLSQPVQTRLTDADP